MNLVESGRGADAERSAYMRAIVSSTYDQGKKVTITRFEGHLYVITGSHFSQVRQRVFMLPPAVFNESRVSLSCAGLLRLLLAFIVMVNQLAESAELEATSPAILFTHAFGLEVLNLTTHTSHSLYNNGHHVFDVEGMWDDGHPQVFWSDFQERRIYGATFHGNDLQNVSVVVDDGISAVEGIAVDWIARNLYWVDSKFGWIEAVSLDMGWRTILVTNVELPRAIAIDSRFGLVFWTDWNKNSPRIERCSTSGSNRSVIVNISELTAGGFPNGLTMDYNRRRIFWIDAKSNSIHSTDYWGQHHEKLLANHSSIEWPFGLTLFDDVLFWVDAKLKTVNKVNVTTGTDVQVLYKTYRSLYGILVLHPGRHPPGSFGSINSNPCKDNGGCSHLCLVDMENRATCHCPNGLTLAPDKKLCIEVKHLLLVSEQLKEFNVIQILNRKTFWPVAPPFVAHTASIFAQEMDVASQTVYWVEVPSNVVWKASVGDDSLRLFDLGFGDLSGFVIDWSERILYYSMLGPRCGIYSCALDSRRCEQVLKNEPLLLQFTPERRQLMWVEWLNESYAIKAALCDRSVIVESTTVLLKNVSILPKGFTVDANGMLCWMFDGGIVVAQDGEELFHLIPSGFGNVTSLTADDDKLIVGTDSGALFTLDLAAEQFSAVQYTSRGSISGLHSVWQDGAMRGTDLPQTNVKDSSSCSLLCLNADMCKYDSFGQLICQCRPGLSSRLCESSICTDFCMNGQCRVDDKDRRHCVCEPGFYGKRCQLSLCTGFCFGGVCNVSRGYPLCSCPDGWHGHRCQFIQTVGASTPSVVTGLCQDYCLNGGTCTVVGGRMQLCSCHDDYNGIRCETENPKDVHYILWMVVVCLIVIACLSLVAIAVGTSRWKKLRKERQNRNYCQERPRLDSFSQKAREMTIFPNKKSSAPCSLCNSLFDKTKRTKLAKPVERNDSDCNLLLDDGSIESHSTKSSSGKLV